MPSPPSPAPQPAEEGKDLSPHAATARDRQDITGPIGSTGSSPPDGKPAPEGPISDPLPREEILLVKREYVFVDIKTLPEIPSFGHATQLTNCFNVLMTVLMKRCEDVETTRDGP